MERHPRLAELSRTECLELLHDTQLGRVGVCIDALPAIFPVFIVVVDEAVDEAVDETVVFRTLPGTKLSAASHGSIVALEVDSFDDTTGQGWSVLVRGIANEVTDPARAAAARARLHASWVDEAPEHFVEVNPDLVTGRRLK